MTTTVLFCFKGRHGLGHARRTMLVAEAMARLAPRLRIVLIGQCRSVALLRRSSLPVVNLPVLERLPNDQLDATYVELLTALGTRLGPSLVVEDTYPDPRHLFLAPFRDVPKALVMSGMTRGGYLERLRQEGLLGEYERILVARDEAPAVDAPDLTPATRTMLRHSTRFRYCGPVFVRPSPAEAAAAGTAYAPDGAPLVVVSAGAGGDVTNQAYPQRLFRSMREVAGRLHADGTAARMVLVAGPYFRGGAPDPLPNLTFVPFAADLPALLHAARVAVIRPGSNVLRETLSGPASVVIVPNFSWAEDQQALAGLVTGSVPQVDRAACDDVDRLLELTRAGLGSRPRDPWTEAVAPAEERVARELLDVLAPAPPAPNLFLVAGGLDTPQRRDAVARHLPHLVHAGDDPGTRLLDRAPAPHETPAALYGGGVRLLLVPHGVAYDPRHGVNYDPGYGFDLPVWTRAHRLADHGLVSAPVHHVRVAAGGSVAHRLAVLRRTDALPAIWLDLRGVPTDALPAHSATVASTLAADGARLATVTDLLDRRVAAQLM